MAHVSPTEASRASTEDEEAAAPVTEQRVDEAAALSEEVSAGDLATTGAEVVLPTRLEEPEPPKEAAEAPRSTPATPDGPKSDVEAGVADAGVADMLWDDNGEEDRWWDPRTWYDPSDIGATSNLATACIFILGVLLRVHQPSAIAEIVLAFGLFAFAGGITNWIAVKMLFDRIPGLWGSGVIPRRFQEILGALKTMILETFFEEQFLRSYLKERATTLFEQLDLKSKLESAMSQPGFDNTLARKLEVLATQPEGMILATIAPMFGGFDTMVPMIKPMLVGIGVELVGTLSTNFDIDDVLDVKAVRVEIDRVLTQRMETLTPKKVKRMMSNVIRVHLGWLVVWGNVFGGLIGILSWAAEY